MKRIFNVEKGEFTKTKLYSLVWVMPCIFVVRTTFPLLCIYSGNCYWINSNASRRVHFHHFLFFSLHLHSFLSSSSISCLFRISLNNLYVLECFKYTPRAPTAASTIIILARAFHRINVPSMLCIPAHTVSSFWTKLFSSLRHSISCRRKHVHGIISNTTRVESVSQSRCRVQTDRDTHTQSRELMEMKRKMMKNV